MENSDFIPASNVSEKFTGDECLSDSLTENRFYRQMVEDLKKCNVDWFLKIRWKRSIIVFVISIIFSGYFVVHGVSSVEKYKKLVPIMSLTLNSQSKRMRLLLMRQMALYLRSVISRNGMILSVRCNNSFVIRKKN